MLPFGQFILSAAVCIGSLAVRMAVFSCAWVWRSGRGGLHGSALDVGAVASTLLWQSHDVAKAMRFRRELERIALDIFLSTRS